MLVFKKFHLTLNKTEVNWQMLAILQIMKIHTAFLKLKMKTHDNANMHIFYACIAKIPKPVPNIMLSHICYSLVSADTVAWKYTNRRLPTLKFKLNSMLNYTKNAILHIHTHIHTKMQVKQYIKLH
jgi:hypothetical protein